jgi:hypothetical protein
VGVIEQACTDENAATTHAMTYLATPNHGAVAQCHRGARGRGVAVRPCNRATEGLAANTHQARPAAHGGLFMGYECVCHAALIRHLEWESKQLSINYGLQKQLAHQKQLPSELKFDFLQ